MIRAPFNFVPLNDKVFCPDWAGQISQDIPFSDGVSGIIKLKITAKSPIFVRDGHKREDEKDKNKDKEVIQEFCHTKDGKYFIPGTSIKGAVRNVLEILSYGKLTQVKNQSFGFRDLGNTADGTFYRSKIKTENVHCGWLTKKDNDYYIDDCDLPWRISVEELDKKYGLGFDDFVKNGNFIDDNNKTARIKYDLWGNNPLEGRFKADFELRKNLKVGGRLFVKFDSDGNDGTIVFTGQPGARKIGRAKKNGGNKWEGKYYEFVIPAKIKRAQIKVASFIIEDFLSIHKDSPDFKDFRKKQLMKGNPIPIFFMYSEDKKEIGSIGLSYMYKYPAFSSIYNAIPTDLLVKSKSDFADCLFGSIDTESPLKGRVRFSPAFLQGEPNFHKVVTYALSSPHPSYYPLYLGNGETWNSEKTRLAGRKRYPVRNNILTNTGTAEMSSSKRPLNPDSEFLGYIQFHNLKKVELGALLSALTFHNHAECNYSLGQGKPLGYGKVKIDTEIQSLTKSYNKEELLNSFETEMNSFISTEKVSNTNWIDQPLLKELFAMARGIPEDKERLFTYMKMSTNRDENEFLNGVQEYSNGKQLGRFTQILSNSVPKCYFIGNVQESKQRINIEKEMARREEQKKKYDTLLEEGKLLLNQNNFAEAINIFDEANTILLSNNGELMDLLKIAKDSLEAQKNEYYNLLDKAKQSKQDKDYKSALKYYTLANDCGINDLSLFIDDCKNQISRQETIDSSTMLEFLASIPLASTNAFANKLKVKVSANLSPEDVSAISEKLKSDVPTLKKDVQKKWRDFRNWKEICKAIGEDVAKDIFNKLNQ